MGSEKKKSALVTKSCRLITMMVLTSSFFLVELIVGYITNSLALVADSFHMLSDIISLIVGFMAVRYARRDTPKNTYGWQRAEVVGALVNAVFLFALCFTILVDAVERLIMRENHIEDPRLVLIVGGVGLAVNLLGVLLFSSHGLSHGHSHGGGGGHGHSHGHSHGKSKTETKQDEEETEALRVNGTANKCKEPEADGDAGDVEAQNGDHKHKKKDSSMSASQLNMRGVFLHVLGDALGSVVVIISALTIMFAEGEWLFAVDPVLSIIIVVIISSTTWPLFKQSGMILLQSIPTGVDIDDLDKQLREQCQTIDNIHEFHVWQLTGDKLIATLHVSVSSLEEYGDVIEQATRILHREGIHSTTIQPEFLNLKRKSEVDCPIPCPTDKCSEKNRCCSSTRRQMGKNGSSASQLQMEVDNLEVSSWVIPYHQYSKVAQQNSLVVGSKLASHTSSQRCNGNVQQKECPICLYTCHGTNGCYSSGP